MGPPGTCTRLHRDVCQSLPSSYLSDFHLSSDNSYSWSTNVVGRKKWWLFPPEVTQYITKPNGETITDETTISSFDADKFTPDPSVWPNWEIAKKTMYAVEQQEGETIFVYVIPTTPINFGQSLILKQS
jgi:hypothetical protein